MTERDLEGELAAAQNQNQILTTRITALARLNLEYRYQLGVVVKFLGHTIEERNHQRNGDTNGR